MTYSESAEGIQITWSRALEEVNEHVADVDDFEVECWDVHAVGEFIDAGEVLRWLGY